MVVSVMPIDGTGGTTNPNVNCKVYDGERNFTIQNCDSETFICLAIKPTDINMYDITDNGKPYIGKRLPCASDSIVRYPYFSIIGLGKAPYFLESWMADGQIHQTEFTTIKQLVDFMNSKDAAANWKIDESTFTIIAEKRRAMYGALNVEHPASGGLALLEPDFESVAKGTSLSLNKGIHNLVIKRKSDGCTDAIQIEVTCIPESGVVENVPIDTVLSMKEKQSIEFCFDKKNVPANFGKVKSIKEICHTADNSIVSINMNVGKLCGSFKATGIGKDTLCMEICDVNGICVTKKIIVNIKPTVDTLYGKVIKGKTDTLCLPTTQFKGGKTSTFTNICDAGSGKFADVELVNGKNCIEFTGETLGKDKACIVQCNAQGTCDTTIVWIQVVPSKKDTMNVLLGFDKEITKICMDTSDLSGKVKSVKNVCTTKSTVQIIINPTNPCIDLKPITEGEDQACIEICDNAGICDTTILKITATKSPLTRPDAIDDVVFTVKNAPVEIDVKNNDKAIGVTNVAIGTKPTKGKVEILGSGKILYTPEKDACDIRDSFTYIIRNPIGTDTAQVKINVLCDKITVFTGFSPNGDGANETLYIAGIENFPAASVSIFNRWGAEVFYKVGYTNSNGFSGKWNGKELPDGTYFYVIDLKDGSRAMSGYVQIQR